MRRRSSAVLTLTRDWICWDFDLGLPRLQNCGKCFLLKPPDLQRSAAAAKMGQKENEWKTRIQAYARPWVGADPWTHSLEMTLLSNKILKNLSSSIWMEKMLFFCLFLCFVFSILDMSKMTQYSSFWTWLVSSIRIANGKIIPLYATVYLCLIFYQVIRWWTLRLTPFPGCWVECDVGRGAGVSSTEWFHLSWPYTQEYNCWITGQFYFWIFLGIFVLPAVAVLV